jgi:hypothetical protein
MKITASQLTPDHIGKPLIYRTAEFTIRGILDGYSFRTAERVFSMGGPNPVRSEVQGELTILHVGTYNIWSGTPLETGDPE